MAKKEKSDEGATRKDVSVVVGAILLAVCPVSFGAVGGTLAGEGGALVGLCVGVVVALALYWHIDTLIQRTKIEPIPMDETEAS